MTEKMRSGFWVLAAAFVMTLGGLIGCVTDDEEAPPAVEMGKAVIVVDMPAKTAAASAYSRAAQALSGKSPTLLPDNTASWSYKLTFNYLGVGEYYHSAVTTSLSKTEEVALEVGSWTITATGTVGGVDVAVSSASVSIVQDETTDVPIILKPNTQFDGTPLKGIFDYKLTWTDAEGTMTLTKTGSSTPTQTVTLPKNEKENTTFTTTGSITALTAGEYTVTVALTRVGDSTKKDGLNDIVHIYGNQTTKLDYTFTAPEKTTVTDLALTNIDIPLPEGGTTAPTTLGRTHIQYDGIITWERWSGSAWVDFYGKFGGETVYKAKLSLLEKPDYTFAGVKANAFTYNDGNSSYNHETLSNYTDNTVGHIINAADTGNVEIVFPKTDTYQVLSDAKISISFDAKIKFTDEGGDEITGSSFTLKKAGDPESVTLSVEDEFIKEATSSWWVGNTQKATNQDSLTLNAADFEEDSATAVTFITTLSTAPYNGRTFSKRIKVLVVNGNVTYTVAQAGNYLKFVFSSQLETFSKANVILANGAGDGKGYAALASGGVAQNAGSAWYLPLETSITVGDITVAVKRDGVDVAPKTMHLLDNIPQNIVTRLLGTETTPGPARTALIDAGIEEEADIEDEEDVTTVFNALHTYIAEKGTTDAIGVGDYFILPAFDQANVKIIVVGKNTFQKGGAYEGTTGSLAETPHLVFQFEKVLKDPKAMRDEDKNSGGYNSSTLRAYLTGTVSGWLTAAGIPSSTIVAPTRTLASSGTGSTTVTNTDAVWLPTEWEVLGSRSIGAKGETKDNQPALDYYRTATSRIKNNSSGPASWWLASPAAGSTSEFCIVTPNGAITSSTASSDTVGIAPAFCFQ